MAGIMMAPQKNREGATGKHLQEPINNISDINLEINREQTGRDRE